MNSKVLIKQGKFKGKVVKIIKKFSSMIKGHQYLVQDINNKEFWINASDLEEDNNDKQKR